MEMRWQVGTISGRCNGKNPTMKLNQLKELFAEDRAVSPVVGVALLIAITVILAAVIGGVVLGIGTGGAETPQAKLTADLDSSENTAEISHDGGEALSEGEVVIKADGEDLPLDEDLTAGGSVDVNDKLSGDYGGGDVTVIWQDPDSSSETVLAEFEE